MRCEKGYNEEHFVRALSSLALRQLHVYARADATLSRRFSGTFARLSQRKTFFPEALIVKACRQGKQSFGTLESVELYVAAFGRGDWQKRQR